VRKKEYVKRGSRGRKLSSHKKKGTIERFSAEERVLCQEGAARKKGKTTIHRVKGREKLSRNTEKATALLSEKRRP